MASASLLAALVGLLLYQVLTGAITRNIATEVTGQTLDLEQSYRFGFARLGPILVVSILVGLATLLGLIVFIIPDLPAPALHVGAHDVCLGIVSRSFPVASPNWCSPRLLTCSAT